MEEKDLIPRTTEFGKISHCTAEKKNSWKKYKSGIEGGDSLKDLTLVILG